MHVRHKTFIEVYQLQPTQTWENKRFSCNHNLLRIFCDYVHRPEPVVFLY